MPNPEQFAIPRKLPAQVPGGYWGLRITADQMDCAMPISLDQYSACSYNCLYCFSNFLMREPGREPKKMERLRKFGTLHTQMPFAAFQKFIERRTRNSWTPTMYSLLDRGQPIQWGGLGEPGDPINLVTNWDLKAIELLRKHNVPIRVSTKSDLWMRDDRLDALRGAKNFIFNFSIIDPDDELMRKVELNVPIPTRRFDTMKALTDVGVRVGLRYRPIFQHLAERKINGEPAWKVMIDKAVEAGARQISYEVVFLNKTAGPREAVMFESISRITGMPNFVEWFKSQSIAAQKCQRTNRLQKYGMMMGIRNYAKERGLIIGISDPHFKEYSDSTCCCGILPDDPIFGKFSEDCLTKIVVEGRKAFEDRGENLQFHFQDWAPEWAKQIKLSAMCALSSAEKHHRFENQTWYGSIRNKWNNPHHFRSPYNYFEGILHPIGLDDQKDVIYEYRDWLTQVYKDVKVPKLETFA